MTAETHKNITKTFKFSYPTCTNEDVLFKLEVPVEIPHNGSTRELVQRVINMFHIPVYLEDELNENLAKFVAEETKLFHNERDKKLLDQFKNSDINAEGIIKNWDKLFKENVVEFADQKGTTDEEVFAAAYHKLVHSPALETILQVENSYARTVTESIKNCDEDVKKLTQRQTEEMEEKLRLLNTFTTEEDINDLAAVQFEEQSVLSARWESQLHALRRSQRAQHRAWLMTTLEEYQTSSALHTPSNSPLGTFTEQTCLNATTPRPQRLEESFTIHLGSQLKQTHNIRIVAIDLLDLCHVDLCDNPLDSSRRLQTSLTLYSTELSAVVLVTEGIPPPSSFTKLVGSSTEHHFAQLSQQLDCIVEELKEPASVRNSARLREQQTSSTNPRARLRPQRALQTGDVYVTKHSNLPDVHVVFHLVADESSLKSNDINSRHPAILGLRNILKTACTNDITSISLPLLLRHELSEEMTAAWCIRRAELVLKCVKGFVLETSGWGGAELRTLQFAVPSDTAPEVFASLATLLPTIFRISNPVKFKASS